MPGKFQAIFCDGIVKAGFVHQIGGLLHHILEIMTSVRSGHSLLFKRHDNAWEVAT